MQKREARGLWLLAIGLAALAPASASLAQTAPKPAPPPAMPDTADPPAESTPEPDMKVPRSEPEKPLSEELKDKEGVLEPPRDLDPKIEQPAPVPEPNSTPVIPPPGSPGGDQSIKPK